MPRSRLRQNSYWIILAAAVAAAPSQAPAQNAGADFYRGKTITISVGFSAGGGYDLHARTLARVLGRHIPGNPAVVVKNVPGAGGLVLMNGLSNSHDEGRHRVRDLRPRHGARTAAGPGKGALRFAQAQLDRQHG